MRIIGVLRALHERPEDNRPCIIHEYVELPSEGATEGSIDPRDQRVDALNGAQICAHGFCLSAGIADFLDDLLRTIGAGRVIDDYGRALGGQTNSDGSSDTAR